MAARSGTVALRGALVELHRQREPYAQVRALFGRLAPVFGRAVACAYLLDRASGEYRLELLEDSAGLITSASWRSELNGPIALPADEAQPALSLLVDSEAPAEVVDRPGIIIGEPWTDAATEALRRATGFRFLAAAPVMSEGEPEGIFLLFCANSWPRDAAADAAAHAGSAIGNAVQLRESSRTTADMFMRGVIDEVGAREINRAERYGRPLSVAVIELPPEESTPARLAASAALLARLMRLPDTAGHLDLHRAVVILPETPAAGGAAFLRRLRRQAGPDLAMLRMGASSFPDDGAKWAGLVETAISRLHVPPPEEPAARRGPVAARIRVAPLREDDVDGWRQLIARLGAVATVQAGPFDGMSATFEVETLSMARLLAQLSSLAEKVEASVTPSVTGDIGLTLNSGRRRLPRIAG